MLRLELQWRKPLLIIFLINRIIVAQEYRKEAIGKGKYINEKISLSEETWT